MKTKTVEQLERALWSACMGNMSMAASWRNQAMSAYARNQSEVDFIASAHPSNRAKARAAYRLIAAEMAEAKANNKGHSPTWEATLEDIQTKGGHYKTARRKSDGAFVSLMAFDFRVNRYVIGAPEGNQSVAWNELDSFTL